VPTSAFPSVHIVGSLTSKLPSIKIYICFQYIHTDIFSHFGLSLPWRFRGSTLCVQRYRALSKLGVWSGTAPVQEVPQSCSCAFIVAAILCPPNYIFVVPLLYPHCLQSIQSAMRV
jgi:hypothetical protein